MRNNIHLRLLKFARPHQGIEPGSPKPHASFQITTPKTTTCNQYTQKILSYAYTLCKWIQLGCHKVRVSVRRGISNRVDVTYLCLQTRTQSSTVYWKKNKWGGSRSNARLTKMCLSNSNTNSQRYDRLTNYSFNLITSSKYYASIWETIMCFNYSI